jgi:hypothetical protein
MLLSVPRDDWTERTSTFSINLSSAKIKGKFNEMFPSRSAMPDGTGHCCEETLSFL